MALRSQKSYSAACHSQESNYARTRGTKWCLCYVIPEVGTVRCGCCFVLFCIKTKIHKILFILYLVEWQLAFQDNVPDL